MHDDTEVLTRAFIAPFPQRRLRCQAGERAVLSPSSAPTNGAVAAPTLTQDPLPTLSYAAGATKRPVLIPPNWEASAKPQPPAAPAPRAQVPEAALPESRLRIFSGTINQALSEEVVHYLGLDLGSINIKRFADGEIYCQVKGEVEEGGILRLVYE